MATKAELEAQKKRQAAAKKAARTRKANAAAKNAPKKRRARRNPPSSGLGKLVVGGAAAAGASIAVGMFAPSGPIATYGAILAPGLVGYLLRKKAKWRAIGDALVVGSALLGTMKVASAFLPSSNPPRNRNYWRPGLRNPAAPLSLTYGSPAPAGAMTYAQKKAAGLVL